MLAEFLFTKLQVHDQQQGICNEKKIMVGFIIYVTRENRKFARKIGVKYNKKCGHRQQDKTINYH